ncbi:hypothetical protein KFK09_009496 [Dendrobium nobile]|uniref:Uncharacterized protein n=1 Tax=Dendrobium nobile TaxID=94219 RepID=A0A8T3BLK9_DENNO|nr:hypothetical protein KFK09_009496 [Dendrobium nobile]
MYINFLHQCCSSSPPLVPRGLSGCVVGLRISIHVSDNLYWVDIWHFWILMAFHDHGVTLLRIHYFHNQFSVFLTSVTLFVLVNANRLRICIILHGCEVVCFA